MRKPCRNLKPTLKPTLNRHQYIFKQPWTNPKETMSLWWPTRHAAGQSLSGAVEGDWLRRGGWLTHCGLTLLVGDRFRLVSSNSPQCNLPSSHRWCWHQWELWTLGASRQNLQTAQASTFQLGNGLRRFSNCKRGCQVFLQVSLFNHLAKTFIVEGGISFHE